MKILYGVQGTGNGHIARARAMAKALKQHHVDVTFLFTGREQDKYFSMEPFGDYKTLRGLTFQVNKGRVSYLKTVLRNSLWQCKKDIQQLDLSEYDLVLNDFEPISAWAAKKQGVPCIGVSHQNAFRYSVPKKGDSWLDQTLIKYFSPATHYIGLHWYHFDQPVLPPIIEPHIMDERPNSEFSLVYLPFEALSEVEGLLNRFSLHPFVCYHPDVRHPYQVENICFKPLSRSGFQADLQVCQGVIANGGFELPSEALSLGKKLLLKPLSGQFEQQSNVATLDYLGLAHTMKWLDSEAVRDWLESPAIEKVDYPDVANHLVKWLLKGRWDDLSLLWSTLWEEVNYPVHCLELAEEQF